MFTKLSVHNFRAIGPHQVEIGLGPLTVLVGKNGSGKSSMLEALALTAQSATDDDAYTELVPSGTKVHLFTREGTGRKACNDLHFGRDPGNTMSVEFEIDGFDNSVLQDRLSGEPPKKLESLERWPPDRVCYRWMRSGTDTWIDWGHLLRFDGENVFSISSTTTTKTKTSRVSRATAVIGGESIGYWSSADGVMPREIFDAYGWRKDHKDAPDEPFLGMIPVFGEWMTEVLKKVQLLSALRGTGLFNRNTGSPVRFIGKNSENLLRLLVNIDVQARPEYDMLVKWAEKFGLKKPKIGIGENSEIIAAFSDEHGDLRFDVNEAPYGARQGLILASQLLLSPKGSTLMIEEPENNMHPEWERMLPDLFSDSIKSGHQIIISTHSEIIIAALGLAVRKGIFKKDDIAVWHMERDNDGARADSVEISDRGNLHEWVKSFSAVEEEMADEWYEELPEAGEPTDS